jgi:signal peptidase I
MQNIRMKFEYGNLSNFMDRCKHSFLENKKLFILMFLIIFIRVFFVSYYHIPTSSMNPNLMEGDIVLVDKTAYNLKLPFTDIYYKINSPNRGDVITFDHKGVNMAKRVVAISGDRIQFIDNKLYVNGEAVILKESTNELVAAKRFLRQQDYPYKTINETNNDEISYDIVFASGFTKEYLDRLIVNSKVFTIPDKRYFVLGDNRNLSMDSRYIGTVHERDVTSKIHYVIFNYSEILDYLFGDLESLRFFQDI